MFHCANVPAECRKRAATFVYSGWMSAIGVWLSAGAQSGGIVNLWDSGISTPS